MHELVAAAVLVAVASKRMPVPVADVQVCQFSSSRENLVHSSVTEIIWEGVLKWISQITSGNFCLFARASRQI